MSYKWQRLCRSVCLVALVGASLGCGADDPATQPDRQTSPPSRLLSVGDFTTYLDDEPSAMLVNVHVPYEGHIEGTDAFVPFDEIELWGELPANSETPIAVYCRSGNMSAEAAAALTALGYTDVVDLEGGMNAWTAAGNQLVTDSS